MDGTSQFMVLGSDTFTSSNTSPGATKTLLRREISVVAAGAGAPGKGGGWASSLFLSSVSFNPLNRPPGQHPSSLARLSDVQLEGVETTFAYLKYGQ